MNAKARYEISQQKRDPHRGLTPVECNCQRPDGSRPAHGPHWVLTVGARKPFKLRWLTERLAGRAAA